MTDDLVSKLHAAIDALEAAALAVRDAPSNAVVIMEPGAEQPSELERQLMLKRVREEHRKKLRAIDPQRALLQEQGDWDVVLRCCTADRRRLERHAPAPPSGRYCQHDALAWPCPDLLDLADSYGIAQA